VASLGTKVWAFMAILTATGAQPWQVKRCSLPHAMRPGTRRSLLRIERRRRAAWQGHHRRQRDYRGRAVLRGRAAVATSPCRTRGAGSSRRATITQTPLRRIGGPTSWTSLAPKPHVAGLAKRRPAASARRLGGGACGVSSGDVKSVALRRRTSSPAAASYSATECRPTRVASSACAVVSAPRLWRLPPFLRSPLLPMPPAPRPPRRETAATTASSQGAAGPCSPSARSTAPGRTTSRHASQPAEPPAVL
jgi:hypothetical protein